jgi:hypothetical protein
MRPDWELLLTWMPLRSTESVDPIGQTGLTDEKIRFRFMLEWGWDPRAQRDWVGHLEITGGRIIQAIPFVHGYGPLGDFCRRLQIVANSSAHGA